MANKRRPRKTETGTSITPLNRTLELTAYRAVTVPIRSTTLALLLNRRVSREMLDEITKDLLDWLKLNPNGLPTLPIADAQTER